MTDIDRNPPPDHSEGAARGAGAGGGRILTEVIRAFKDDWRTVIIAIIGALIGVLLGRWLGEGGDLKIVAAVLGAAAGVWIKALAERFGWRDRTLTAIATLLGWIGMPDARRFLLEQSRSVSAKLGVAAGTTKSGLATATPVVAVVIAAVAVTAAAETLSNPPPSLAGRWQTTKFSPTPRSKDLTRVLASERWDISRDPNCGAGGRCGYSVMRSHQGSSGTRRLALHPAAAGTYRGEWDQIADCVDRRTRALRVSNAYAVHSDVTLTPRSSHDGRVTEIMLDLRRTARPRPFVRAGRCTRRDYEFRATAIRRD